MLKEFYKPANIEDALVFLTDYGDSAKIIAGGTDVMVNYRNGKAKFERLVSVSGVAELKGVNLNSDGSLWIGASTILNEVLQSEVVMKAVPILCLAAKEVGCNSIRNMATLGGNLCNASPASDIAPALLALEATFEIVSNKGKKLIPVESFFKGPGKTTLEIGEILVGVNIPAQGKHGYEFIKLGMRKAMEVAIISCACAIRISPEGICSSARIALGAVAPTPVLVSGVSDLFCGKSYSEINEQLIEKAGEVSMEAINPISDIRAKAEYRKNVSKELVGKAINAALMRIGG